MGKKILIVDDEPDAIEMLKMRLLNSGYDVTYVYDGKGCLEKAISERPNLIILDVLLPGVNGFEICKRLKENIETKNIPVIILTALVGSDIAAQGLDKGAAYFVSKPFNPDELLDKIKELVVT
jgi:DNA-binding response OmpR family regulator